MSNYKYKNKPDPIEVEKAERLAFQKQLDEAWAVNHPETDFALETNSLLVIEAYETLMNPEPYQKGLNIPN